VTEALYGILSPVLFPAAAFAVKRWGLRRVQQRLLDATPSRPRERSSEEAIEAARRLAWVVEVAARRGPWAANCLQRSLTLWWFLQRQGLAADLMIGVRRRSGTSAGARTLDFHAWVEHQGVVLNDVPSIRRRFATFERPIAPPSARWD
jgi:hypothetical protein